MVHIRNVQTAPVAAEAGRLFEDVSALPTWPGGALGKGGGVLSDGPLVVNRKWHSSSSAFPPPPHLALFVFCLVFFVCADCDELDGTVGSSARS